MSKMWTMQTGEEIAIKDMDDRHLMNSIRMLERNAEAIYDRALGELHWADPQGDGAQDAVRSEIRQMEQASPRDFLEEATPYLTLLWHAKRRGLLKGAGHGADTPLPNTAPAPTDQGGSR